MPEQPHCRPLKLQPAPLHNGMIDFPAIDHAQRPGVADSQCNHSYKETEDAPSNVPGKPAVEIRILCSHRQNPFRCFSSSYHIKRQNSTF